MKLYYGGYGHNPSGQKQYVYWGGDNYRTGQNVVAPVTNKKGKTYNTMFTIQRTTGVDAKIDAEEKALNLMGIDIKLIGTRDILSLPSGQNYSSKAEWSRESQAKYNASARQRLMSDSTTTDTSRAREQLMGV